MNRMIANSCVVVLALLASSVVFANVDSNETSSASSHALIANINAGNIETGGTLNVSHTFSNAAMDSSTLFTASIPVQYFVWDHLSVGGTVSFATATGYTAEAVGPAATYYFWSQQHIASYIGQALEYSHANFNSNSYLSWNSKTTLGANYFITPSVAFGPAIEYNHSFKTDSAPSMDTVSMIGAFRLYL